MYQRSLACADRRGALRMAGASSYQRSATRAALPADRTGVAVGSRYQRSATWASLRTIDRGRYHWSRTAGTLADLTGAAATFSYQRSATWASLRTIGRSTVRCSPTPDAETAGLATGAALGEPTDKGRSSRSVPANPATAMPRADPPMISIRKRRGAVAVALRGGMALVDGSTLISVCGVATDMVDSLDRANIGAPDRFATVTCAV